MLEARRASGWRVTALPFDSESRSVCQLAASGATQASVELRRRLDSGDPAVIDAAVRALIEHRGRDGLALALRTLEHHDAAVTATFLAALATAEQLGAPIAEWLADLADSSHAPTARRTTMALAARKDTPAATAS